MTGFRDRLSWALDQRPKVAVRLRASIGSVVYGLPMSKLGRSVKIRGARHMTVGGKLAIGDFCWLEAISKYGQDSYSPVLQFGDGVALSDMVHISCAAHVRIDSDVLVGSKVYIGDHSHGSLKDRRQRTLPPAKRPLGDIAPIHIGRNVWVGDGAVILAGSEIADGSIVAANSVVRLAVEKAALIGGVPAKVIRYLDDE